MRYTLCYANSNTQIQGNSFSWKVMASVFWDSDGVIMIDYLEHGRTITGRYYSQLLIHLRESIKQKRRGKVGKSYIN